MTKQTAKKPEDVSVSIVVAKEASMPWLRQGNQWMNEKGYPAVSIAGLERAAANLFVRAPVEGVTNFGTLLPLGATAVAGSQAVLTVSQLLPGAAGIALAGAAAIPVAAVMGAMGIVGSAVVGWPLQGFKKWVEHGLNDAIAPDLHDRREVADKTLKNGAISISITNVEPVR